MRQAQRARARARARRAPRVRAPAEESGAWKSVRQRHTRGEKNSTHLARALGGRLRDDGDGGGGGGGRGGGRGGGAARSGGGGREDKHTHKGRHRGGRRGARTAGHAQRARCSSARHWGRRGARLYTCLCLKSICSENATRPGAPHHKASSIDSSVFCLRLQGKPVLFTTPVGEWSCLQYTFTGCVRKYEGQG